MTSAAHGQISPSWDGTLDGLRVAADDPAMPAREDSDAPLVPSGFFALRTPLLPFGELLGWTDGTASSASPDDPVALAHDRDLLRTRLRAFVVRPEVREAIFVSSPQLEELIDEWTADPESARGAQCERALVRFVARMAGRATPFGLFAGVSIGTLADETRLTFQGQRTYQRHTRLDAGFLVEVVEGLLGDASFRRTTKYLPNPSLYLVGDRRRYVRSQPAAEEQRHMLVSVRDSETLTGVLAAAAHGATPDDLAATVKTDTAERRHRYVDDLIEQRVLVPNFDLQMTGSDSTYGLAGVVPVLADVHDQLDALDEEPLGISPERYRRIADKLEPLPGKLDLNRLFQVDMTKRSPEATLGLDVVDEILRGAELLRRIGSAAEVAPMKRFVERFQERFEQRAVPLLEALDPDLGVSFDGDGPAEAPLLAGLHARDERPAAATWGAREEHLLSRLLEAHESGDDELVLGSVDLEQLAQKHAPPLPDACAVMAVVAAASQAALARGRFRVLISSADGPSGARLLGRFCHADFDLHAAVAEHLRAEEALDPDAIFAEIVHLPRARDANVVARPVLRDFELACLGTSGASPQKQLQLEDLLVSVEEGRVVLRSRRLGRRVIPRLTTAHNFGQRGAVLYRFLCHVQAQGPSVGAGFWGPLADAPRLPRVRSGRVVLERARWRLVKDDLDRQADRDADFSALQEWRRLRRVPRFVFVVGDGLELPTDLDNVLAVESLIQLVRSHGSAHVIEMFPDPQELCAYGPEGTFVHELVVPFVRKRAVVLPQTRPPNAATTRRTFTPGSDWLYARIYTGETIADRVLTNDIAPLVRELVGKGTADRWFFLRYRDPAFHLRVRFHGDSDRLQAEALPALQALGADLVERGSAWRLELGTYEREVERYGGPHAIQLVEEAFHVDSDAVLAVLPILEPGQTGQEERWRLGICGVHRLLVDLGFDLDQRLAIARENSEAIALRLGWDKTVLGHIGDRFRRERRNLQPLLEPDPDAPTGLEPGLEILTERSHALKSIGSELKRLESHGHLSRPRSNIAGSLLHIHLNRLLRGDNTAQEAVICEFLARLYKAESRRQLTGQAATSDGAHDPTGPLRRNLRQPGNR